mgnify:FL=1
MDREIVVSVYDKDLSWLSTLHEDIKKTVYRKGEYTLRDGEIGLTNVGRDVHTFFNHLYLNYDNLSDITFFTQDYPFDHWEDLVDVVNNNRWSERANLVIGGYYGFHFNTNRPNTTISLNKTDGTVSQITVGKMWKMKPTSHHGSGSIISCNSDGTPQAALGVYNIDMNEYWDKFFVSTSLSTYEFIPGGHFGITREHAQLRSRSFYKQVVDLLLSVWSVICLISNIRQNYDNYRNI